MFVHWFVFEITIETNNDDKRLIIQFVKKKKNPHNLPEPKDVFNILFNFSLGKITRFYTILQK